MALFADSPSQQPLAAETQASLRGELEQAIESARAAIEDRLSELRAAAAASGDGLGLAQAEAQLQGLARLQRRVAQATGSSLAGIRAEVTAVIAATEALSQQARSSAASAQAAEGALEAASLAARREIGSFVSDFYDRKIFDPYLRFASAEDEEAYRKREAERRQAIEKVMAEHTPQGDLRANELALAQLKDAGAHGATASPDYQRYIDGLTGSDDQLKSKIAAARPDVAQQQASPASPDPWASVKPSLAASSDELAALRAHGVTVDPTNDGGHGLSQQQVAGTTIGRG